MEELNKYTSKALEFQSETERAGLERFRGYKAEIATLLKNMKSNSSRTPVREKKKPKRGTNNESSTNSEATQSSGRPIRSAAEKAKLELKEAVLGTKMRQEACVKQEHSKENNPNSINIKMEKLSIAHNKKSNERSSNPKIGDESVIVVPANANVVVQLSDDEDEDNEVLMMPPPPKPAPRKINSKKVAASTVTVKSEQIENLASQRPLRSTRGKRLVPQPIVQPKSEKLSNEAPAVEKTNVTLESVYEDAITEDQSAGSSKPFEIEEQIDVASSLPGESVDSTFIQPPKPAEATFVSNNQQNDRTIPIQSLIAGDATFVSQDPEFHSGVSNNETFCMPPASTLNDATIVLEKATKTSKQTSISSIMTEDDSDNDIPLQALSNKQNNELFNPCVQSPMKKKVEAFEKHAQDAQIPAQQRQTRTKTRARATAGDESGSISSTVSAAKAKFNTPNLADQRNNAKGTHFTPQSVNAAIANQGSKLIHLNRAASATRIPQHSRDNSAEDPKRGLQAVADEKKRKREEKLKQVQHQREAREKEKLDKFVKQMQEKEEKVRQEAEKKRLAKEKKDREAETRRNLEEINRNLKQHQQKQKEDALRAEREQMDLIRIAAEKKALQQRLKQNIVVAAKKKPATTKYVFEMLNTDDETDDESNPKPGRPTPPEWSLRGNREERIASQSYVSTACIEQLFPAIAMTPNLKELFPDISEKQLRRNSSAVWNTPPRYSTMQLPKYDA